MDDIPYRTRTVSNGHYGSKCEADKECHTYTQTDIVVQAYDYDEQHWSEPLVYCKPHLKEITVWIKNLEKRL